MDKVKKNESPFKLAVLISGEGSNLQAIIDAIDAGELNASVEVVISNKASANGLNRAKQAGITAVVVAPVKGRTREEYDQCLLETLAPFTPDLIVLAGFMRILSADFVHAFADKIINIHPSLLPAYKGMDTHQRVLDAGEPYHGATVHFVTEKLDDGEIIIQSRIKIRPDDDAESLQKRVHVEEHVIYPRAIQWLTTRKQDLVN
ncbi:MAG: phosphoribosylglycinamide formyltransferase [Proteobacteria bacterium]|nr:phosphoribosylglycinamide formyltransferase [Pseudomonadota bacterium]